MKNLILITAILIAGFSVVKAQTSDEGTALLTVNLRAVQSITVSGDVVIDYKTANDYVNGAMGDQETTLNVVSAGGFVIRVHAADLENGSNVIPASSIAVTAKGDDASFDNNGTLDKVEDKTPLIKSPKGGVNKIFKVSYKGDNKNAYMENYNAEGGDKPFITTVYYTIAAN